MKTNTAALAIFAVLAACLVAAADVAVRGAQQDPMPAAVDVRIATKDVLNRPTALLNKNAVATDNNVLVSRSNVLKTQNDRVALMKEIDEALTMANVGDADPSATAVLTKNVMRAVSGSTDDSALMTKASAVVAAKDDPATLARTIASFVDAAIQKEQSLQSNDPNGVIVRIGTTDLLRQPTAAINKNAALAGNQITIARSDVTPTQNDQIVLRGAKVATAIAPASSISMGRVQSDESDSEEELEKKKKKKTKKSGGKETEGEKDAK